MDRKEIIRQMRELRDSFSLLANEEFREENFYIAQDLYTAERAMEKAIDYVKEDFIKRK